MGILRVSMIFFDTLILFLHTISVVVLLVWKKLLKFAYQSTNNYKPNTR